MANNHTLDFGADALMDTLDHLRAVGVAAVGAGGDEGTARAPVVLRGVGLACASSRSSDHPSSYAAAPGHPGIAFADLAGGPVPRWLLSACPPDADADVTIVLGALGAEYARCSRAARPAGGGGGRGGGRDLIAGHSHVPQGPRGRTLFDLGDFIDDYAVDPELRNDLGLLWLVTLEADGPRRFKGVPLRLEFAHTRLAGPEEARQLRSRLKERCAAVGSSVQLQGDRLSFDPSP